MTYKSESSSRVRREWPQSRRSRLELAVAPAAVRTARQWTAEQLGRAGLGRADADADLFDSAVLAVSELVTNAIAAVAATVTAELNGSAVLGAAPAAGAQATVAGTRVQAPRQLLLAGHPNGAALPGAPVTSAIVARPAAARSPAAPRVWLIIECLGELVRIEVHDSCADPLPPAGPGNAEEETGRGLMVVGALAKSWGWEPEPTGKVVWCELAG